MYTSFKRLIQIQQNYYRIRPFFHSSNKMEAQRTANKFYSINQSIDSIAVEIVALANCRIDRTSDAIFDIQLSFMTEHLTEAPD